jgi:hypothetical protein
MRRFTPALFLAAAAAVAVVGCSSDSSSPAPQSAAVGPSSTLLQATPGSVSVDAYCNAARQLSAMEKVASTGTIPPSQVQALLSQVNQSAPVDIKNAYGVLFKVIEGDSGAATAKITDYNKANCKL